MLMCRDLAMIASDYIDGELGTVGKLSVKMHLMMCGNCRTFIGNLRASTELMKVHTSGTVDDEFVRHIDERVAEALEAREQGNNQTKR